MKLDFYNKYMEIIFVIAIVTILALLGIYYFPMIIFLYPVLFIILGARQGLNNEIVSLFISALIIGIMLDWQSGILLLISFGPLSIAITYLITNRKKAVEVLFISTLVFLASVLVIMAILKDISGIGIIEQLDQSFSIVIKNQIDMLMDLELPDYEILQAEDLYKNSFDYILTIIPSFLMIFCLVVTYVNYLVSALALRKLEYAVVYIPRFSRFKLPRNILLGIIIMFIATYLLSYLNLFNSDAVLTNIIVIAYFVFYVQGLSIIDYKLIKKKAKTITRILVALLVLFFSLFMSQLVILLGVFDVIFDFRKLNEKA